MADGNENKPHLLDIVPSLVIKIEELHERDSVNKVLEGRKQVNLNIFYNAVILNGIQEMTHSFDIRDRINDKLVTVIRENRVGSE